MILRKLNGKMVIYFKSGNKREIHVESEIDKLDDAMEKLKKWKKSDVVELEITETGETVGTKGENLVKIVISSDGGMLSAYPIKKYIEGKKYGRIKQILTSRNKFNRVL